MKPLPPVATEELLFLTCPPLMSPLVRGRQLSPTSQQTLSVTESLRGCPCGEVPKNEYLTGNVANTLAEQPLQGKGEHIRGG